MVMDNRNQIEGGTFAVIIFAFDLLRASPAWQRLKREFIEWLKAPHSDDKLQENVAQDYALAKVGEWNESNKWFYDREKVGKSGTVLRKFLEFL